MTAIDALAIVLALLMIGCMALVGMVNRMRRRVAGESAPPSNHKP